MHPPTLLLTLFSFTAAFLVAGNATTGGVSTHPADAAQRHLSVLSEIFPQAEVKPPSSVEAQWIEQAPGQPYELPFAPVWVVRIPAGSETSSYLMWETSASGELVEFALTATPPSDKFGQLLSGVPSLQQFPVAGHSQKFVASGCVPTAGGSMIGYWVTHGCPEWSGTPAGKPVQTLLKDYTTRLRARLRMAEIPDTVGYTENGMPLSGAFPKNLATALEEDAKAMGLEMKTSFHRYNCEMFKREISAQRPVLLSCQVRLPQKPHLSWGHEVIGVGWLKMNGRNYIGIKDNFFPCADEDTVRWIRDEAFESMIFVRKE